MIEKKPFPICTPEEAGAPSDAVERYMRAVAENDLQMHGVIMTRNGKCFYESYWKPFTPEFPHRLYSCSKSFVSVAVGMAVEQGYIRLDDKCLSFFPDRAPKDPHPYLARMTIRDLLRMASCWTKGANYTAASPDWEETFFTDEVGHVPGTVYSYCTSGTTMLCDILYRATGKQFLQILRPVFDEIGVGEAFCVEAPVGGGKYIEWGGSGVVMTMRDFAKFANLCMRYGRYGDKQLLPEAYMREATSWQIDNSLTGNNDDEMQGYGYQFWMTKNGGFSFHGMGGQYAVCFPEKDLVIATTGYEELKKTGRLELFRALWRELWPEISDTPLPENPAARKKLLAFGETLSLAVAPGEKDSPVRKLADGKTYRMDENPMGIRWTRFRFTEGGGVWEYENATGEHAIRFAFGSHEKQEFPERYRAIQIDKQAEKGYTSYVSAGFRGDTLLLYIHVADVYLGQLRLAVCFRDDTVTLNGYKHAEWFLDEFEGFASGQAEA